MCIHVDYWYLGVAITDEKETSIYSSVNIIQSANSFFPTGEGDFLRPHQIVSLTIENNYSR